MCFTVFLIICCMGLIGNGFIVLVTEVESSLHSPSYFLLRIFAFPEICSTSVSLRNILVGLLRECSRICFHGCDAQLYFLVWLGGNEILLLTSMAYNHYVTICDLLH